MAGKDFGPRASNPRDLSTKQDVDSTPVTALTIVSGVVTVDLSKGNLFTLLLSAAVTSIVFTNPPGAGYGTTKMIRITQGSTPVTLAFPSTFRWEGSAPAISSTANAVDLLAITTFDNGTKWDATLSKGRV